MNYPSSTARSEADIPDLSYKSWRKRNLGSRFLSLLAGLFALLCVLPLIAVLAYVLIKGISTINWDLFTQLPPPPGGEGGGVFTNWLADVAELEGWFCQTTALAGVGPDATRVVLVADPAATSNRHELRASGAFGELDVRIDNAPLPDNPKSSAMAALALARSITNRSAAVAI